jgi:hypothetical protein
MLVKQHRIPNFFTMHHDGCALNVAGHGLLSHGAPGGLCHHALSGAAQHEARPKALEEAYKVTPCI